MKRLLIATAVIAALFMSSAAPAAEKKPQRRTTLTVKEILKDGSAGKTFGAAKADYFINGLPGPDPNSESYVEFKVSTEGLDPDNAYTIWLIVFNLAGNCTDRGPRENLCGPKDFVNPATVVSVMYGAGGLPDKHGRAEFSGVRRQGDLSRVVIGPGLINTEQAEVHMVVRDHGKYNDVDYRERQTQSFNGGCDVGAGELEVDPTPLFDDTLPSRCEDVQTTLVSK